MVAVFVRENDAVELLGHDAAPLQTQYQLPRAEPAIDESFAVIGCDQRAVSRAPTPEYGQAEHGTKGSRASSGCANGNEYHLERWKIVRKCLANCFFAQVSRVSTVAWSNCPFWSSALSRLSNAFNFLFAACPLPSA